MSWAVLVVGAIIGCVLLGLMLYDSLRQFQRTYFRGTGPGEVKVTTESLFRLEARDLAGVRGSVLLYVAKGLFKRPSQIFGPEPMGWDVAKTWQVSNPASGYTGDRVSLVDTEGIAAEIAIKIVSKYWSLETMWYDLGEAKKSALRLQNENDGLRRRCAELEREKQSLDVRYRNEVAQLTGTKAAIAAMLRIMDQDKQRYRSVPAQRLHACLGELLHWQTGQPDMSDPTEATVRLWQEKLLHPEFESMQLG